MASKRKRKKKPNLDPVHPDDWEIVWKAVQEAGWIVCIDGVWTRPHQVPRNLFGRGQLFPVARKNPEA